MDPEQDSPVLLHLLGVKDADAVAGLANPEAVKAKAFEIFRQLSIKCSLRTAPGPGARGPALGRQDVGRVPRISGGEYRATHAS